MSEIKLLIISYIIITLIMSSLFFYGALTDSRSVIWLGNNLSIEKLAIYAFVALCIGGIGTGFCFLFGRLNSKQIHG